MAPLGAERFAEILAYIEHFGGAHLTEILERLDVEQATFSDAASDVPLALADEASAGNVEPVKAFDKRLTETKANLAVTKPSIESLGPRRADRSRAAPAAKAEGEQTLDPKSAAVRDAALPFADAGGAPPPPPHAVEADRSGATVALGSTDGAAAATPFEQRQLNAWTVERYAAFVSDRRVEDVEAARREYDIPNEAFEQLLLQHMNKLFGRAPEQRARWLALIAHHNRQKGRG